MLIEKLKDYLGFAVAGNFAGHLGEAGEADEFSVIKTEDKNAPKGLFPFYIKGHESFFGTYLQELGIAVGDNPSALLICAKCL